MNDLYSLSKLSNAFSLEKRFQNDYEVIKEIGKGESSTVYKVRNLLDNSVYAVKEIVFKVNKSNIKSIQEEINNLVHEVRLLARLKNEYVVTYNNSWIELKLKDSKEEIENLETVEDENLIKKDSTKDEMDEMDNQCDDSISHDDDSQNKICLNEFKFNIEDLDSFVLYIQMEFCKESLFENIQRKNILIKRRKVESYIKENEKEILKTFVSICKAVNYLHSEEKIIHRDLRLKSIFISEEGKFKIGDFGLATVKKLSKSCKSNNNSSINQNVNSTLQQLNNNNDFNSDIYSLGLILFDLVYPMKSNSDNEIKMGIIPEIIKDQSPIIYKLLEIMICVNSKKKVSCMNFIVLIKEYLKKINDNCKSIKKIFRQRFLSEDNEGQKKFEIFFRLDDERNQEWQIIWIIIKNNRLLIFSNNDTSKATMCYNLLECEISGVFVDYVHKKVKFNKSVSKNNFNEVTYEYKTKFNKNKLLDELNFEIHVDHPYLNNCYLKCDSLIDSLELYNNFMNLTSN